MKTERERALSKRQAWNCETARERWCHCRCGGRLHGAKRVMRRDELATLPNNDPHHIAEPDHFCTKKYLRHIWRALLLHEKGGMAIACSLTCGDIVYVKKSRGLPKGMALHCLACWQRDKGLRGQPRSDGRDLTPRSRKGKRSLSVQNATVRTKHKRTEIDFTGRRRSERV